MIVVSIGVYITGLILTALLLAYLDGRYSLDAIELESFIALAWPIGLPVALLFWAASKMHKIGSGHAK